MESALISPTVSILLPSKWVKSYSGPLPAKLHCGLSAARLQLSRCGAGSLIRGLGLHRDHLQFSVRSAAGGGGGGDGAAGGYETKPAAMASGAADEAFSSDIVVLGVGGMMCGGCAESVRKILESQPQVASARVNHETKTAIVWPISEAKAASNWQKDIGQALAKHLTNCGFESNHKDQGATEGTTQP